eukprot:4561252-Amphidinium_carterae.2
MNTFHCNKKCLRHSQILAQKQAIPSDAFPRQVPVGNMPKEAVTSSKDLTAEGTPYSTAYPDEELCFRDHFSSLLLSGEWGLTILEIGSLASLVAAAQYLPAEKVNVKGSMTLKGLAALLCTKAA